jgi:hypothetical protein
VSNLPVSITRVRLLVVVGLWIGFVGALYFGTPPPGHSVRPLLWVTMVLLSLRVIYGTVTSNKRRG